MTEEDARKLVQSDLESSTVTHIDDFGDVFAVYFANDEYLRTKRFEDMAIGAGPTIVDKTTGKVFPTGSGQSVEKYVQAYRACGDVYGQLGDSLKLSGLPKELDKKAATIQLKQTLGFDLTQAREVVETILSDHKAKIKLANHREAAEQCKSLHDAGYTVEHLWESKN